jgi:hypothetical protein
MKFTFNLHGYMYQQGIKILWAAYSSASSTLYVEWDTAKDDAIAYQKALDAGEVEWEGERDEDGYVIWDKAQIHDMEIDEKGEALSALRKAFILALYHHWERRIRACLSSSKKTHAELVKSAIDIGIPIHPGLNAVRDLANLLKHENGKWGEALRGSWPSLFPNGFQKSKSYTNWYDAVKIDEKVITEAFDIVARSGPIVSTRFKAG